MLKFIMILSFLNIILFANEKLISGYIKEYNYMDISGALSDMSWTNKKLDKDKVIYDRGGLTLQLRLNSDITKNIYFNSIIEFDYDFKNIEAEPTSSNSDGMTIFFKEGYIGVRDIGGFLDIKLGRQYIFWGKFEEGGALDVISPWNFMSMSAEKENYRVAVDALKFDFDLSDFATFEAVFLPVSTSNKMDIPDEMGPFVRVEAVHPDRSIMNTEIGLKLVFELGEETDFSFNYFNGYDRNFSIVIDQDKGIFTPTYNPIQVYGFDLETIFFDTVWLLELAYINTADEDGKDFSVKNKNIKAAFGFEKEFSFGLSLSAQLTYVRLLEYDRQREYDFMSLNLGDDVFVSRLNTYGVVYRVRYHLNSSVSFQFLGSSDLLDLNMMNLLFASWSISSQLKSYIGVINFRGQNSTRFGRLEEFSRFFFELKYLF